MTYSQNIYKIIECQRSVIEIFTWDRVCELCDTNNPTQINFYFYSGCVQLNSELVFTVKNRVLQFTFLMEDIYNVKKKNILE